MLGIKVKIMLPWDPVGKTGPKKPLPDHVTVQEPKEEVAKEFPAPSLVLLPGPGVIPPHKVEIMPETRAYE